MDLSEVGAELGSCWGTSRRNLIGVLQNQPEVANSYQDRGRQEGYDGEVGRQGHPQNFVRPSIEGEQKFGGSVRGGRDEARPRGVSEGQARGNSAAEGQCLRGQAGVRR